MPAANWFDVDRDGLRKILERRGKAWAIFELIQNGWDTNARNVTVSLEAIVGKAQVQLIVTDDDPDGFHDITHAYTLFAESGKKTDPTKRGRFNLGCKLVLAMCYEAEVRSTTGAVRFDDEGRHTKGLRRTAEGSVFSGRLAMTREELGEVENQIYKLLPPPDVTTTVQIKQGSAWTEGTLSSRDFDTTFEATLLTEIADGEGYLRRLPRKTTVQLYSTLAGEAMLYELGLPVQSIEGPWHINVMQKLPQGFDRDSVPPAYLSRVQTLAANHALDMIPKSEFTAPWVAEVVQDKNVEPAVVERYLQAKYGDKYVIDVPGSEGQESGREAVANGYAVIRGGSEARATWEKIKEHSLANKATALFPPPSKSSNWEEIPEDKLAPVWKRLKAYAQGLASKVLDAPVGITTEPRVRFIDGPALSTLASWERSREGYSERPTLMFNVALLGAGFFAQGPTVEVNRLLIHEFAHEYGDHLEEKFDDAMARLGAKMVELALVDPDFFFYHVEASRK